MSIPCRRDKELFYRGTLLLALNAAFRGRVGILGAPIGYGGLLTSILLGITHALSYKVGALDFDLLTLAMTGVPSLLLLWLRARRGSLLLTVIAYNVADGAGPLF